MGDHKLLVVAIDGVVDWNLGFTRKGVVGWRTIIDDLISSGYYFAVLEFSDDVDVDYGDNGAVVKFQASKKYAFIYGHVTMNDDHKYCVVLDESSQFNLPSNCNDDDDASLSSIINSNSRRSGYLLSLPDDLKLKIVESLDGVYLAKLGCVCSELRDLFASKEDLLWKHRFLDEFSNFKSLIRDQTSWKHKFVKALKIKRSCSICYMVPVGGRILPGNYLNFVQEVLWPTLQLH